MSDIPESLGNALAGRYDIRDVLGRGGMATVYRANDVRHRRQVAVKVLRSELSASIGVDRFLKEIEIAAGLHHPHILMLIDSGEVDGVPYYVMPLVEGQSLRHLLERSGTIATEDALAIAAEVADALDFAHQRGVIHRDIKPENILLANGHAVVADFGIAKAISTASGGNLTQTGFPVGTPGYMSPEQAAGLTDLDGRSDIFSLACVCFEMFTGTPPGRWPTESALRTARFESLETGARTRLDALPRAIESSLVQAMAIRPEQRHASATALIDALRGSHGPARRRFDPEAVERIILHATELEAQSTVDRSMTIGGLEAIATEAHIPAEHIREAAKALERPTGGLVRGGIFGLRPEMTLERFVEGEISPESYGALLEDIRVILGETGTLAETLGNSLVWNSPSRGIGRKTSVLVSPADGSTRIRFVDDDRPPGGTIIMAPIVAVSAILIGITGAVVSDVTGSDLQALLAALAVSGTFFSTTYLLARRSFRRELQKRSRTLHDLMDRLTQRIGHSVDPHRRLPHSVATPDT
jgi:serine/threonine protein kinase